LSEDFAAGGGEMKRNAMMFVEESRGRMWRGCGEVRGHEMGWNWCFVEYWTLEVVVKNSGRQELLLEVIGNDLELEQTLLE
jgi:hypothetical protein